MNTNPIRAIRLLSAVLLLLVPASGRAADFALGAKAGTLGFGAELTAGVHERLDFRLGIQGFDYSETREASDIEYDGKAEARFANAFLDLHPFGGGFRLTGGALYNDSRVLGQSLVPASGTYDIGGIPVPANLVGTLAGRIEFDPIVPYAGLGWGNAMQSRRALSFSLDLGVAFIGTGDVTLTPQIPAGSPLNDPFARALLDIQLEREAREIEDDLEEDYDLYPVLSVGLAYRF